MSPLASLFVRHPSRVYITLAPGLALAALSPTPSLVPLILLLALLRLHTFTVIPRRQWKSIASQVVLVSLAIVIVHSGPSLHALSTPTTSVIVLSIVSAAITTLAGATMAAGYYAERAARASWAHATVFPATWATAWAAVEYCSPIGQLTTWSPIVGLGGYAWLRQIGGQVAINWVVAAWAVVISDAVGAWVIGPGDGEQDVDISVMPENTSLISIHEDDDLPVVAGVPTSSPASSKAARRTRPTLLLTGALLALAIPSYVLSDIPPVVSAPDVTPFGVACAMPYRHVNGKPTGPPSLEDYVQESKTLQSQAKVVLWPESAVQFHARGEKEEAFEHIMPVIAKGSYYAIGFEETIHSDSPDGVWKVGMRRNGLVLLGREGVVYEYYKRHLVPIAESFSLTPANEKPSIFTMQLPHPKSWTAPTWAPAPDYTRPIDITASICLDFSHASSFSELPSRPALILAPARTWHTSVGLAMWEQAKARAEEMGSIVLWCDGGEGGVSGIAGRGMHAFRQVGPGSWAQTVSVPWPFDQRRTLFSVGGTVEALAVVWAIVGAGWIVHLVEARGQGAGGALVGMVRGVQSAVQKLGQRERRGEQEPLLG